MPFRGNINPGKYPFPLHRICLNMKCDIMLVVGSAVRTYRGGESAPFSFRDPPTLRFRSNR